MANYKLKLPLKMALTTGRNMFLNILCIQTEHNIKVHLLAVDTLHKTAMNI
jgi:hypothetical protein